MNDINEIDNNLEKVDVKPSKNGGNEKLVIGGIIAGVLLIAMAIFMFFYYKTNLTAVVTFDGGKVNRAEYTVYYKIFAPMLEYYNYPASEIPNQVANKAGIDKIILMKAKAAGITLSDENKAKVDEIFTDKAQVKQYTDKGISAAKMKELYYNDYTITAYIEKMKEQATDDQMKDYIKSVYGDDANLSEYLTKQILFSFTDASTGSSITDEAKATLKTKAMEVLNRALAGEDFAALVSEFSDDTGTKANGGEYKMYLDSRTVEAYVEAVKTLQVGQITPALVESDYGFHIIKLEKITENGRLQSDAEREDYVSEKLDSYGIELNMKINDKLLKTATEAITGVSLDTTADLNSTGTVDNNTGEVTENDNSQTPTTNE